MTRRSRAAAAALLVAVAFAASPLAAQEPWKTAALASFDDAWSTIDKTLYDPSAGGLDWTAVRDALRPKAEAAASMDGVRAVISEMLGRLHRSHFTLLPLGGDSAETMGAATVPIDVRLVADAAAGPDGPVVMITHVEDDSSAARAGLHAGQILRSVDGVAASAWLRDTRALDARARNLEIWRRVTRALHGDEGSSIRLTTATGDISADVTVTRELPAGQIVKLGNLPPLSLYVDHRVATTPAGKRAGYIAFNYWLAQINQPFADAIDEYRHADGLVIDLRGNPGGLAAMIRNLAGQIIATPDVLGTMHTRENTLTFTVNPRLSTDDGRSVQPFAGPVALLVDGLTGSTSECFAAALQDLGRVRVFGRETMGAALPAQTKTLPDGDVLEYAIGDFVTSKGRKVEGEGVTPDEPVRLTAAALLAGHDPDLEAALRWIDKAGR